MLNFTCYCRDAWKAVEGTGNEDAKKNYIELLVGVRLSRHCYLSLLDS
jgi:acyl-CoA-binding protein